MLFVTLLMVWLLTTTIRAALAERRVGNVFEAFCVKGTTSRLASCVMTPARWFGSSSICKTTTRSPRFSTVVL